eukprot:1633338-Prymnesium_polylepis.1
MAAVLKHPVGSTSLPCTACRLWQPLRPDACQVCSTCILLHAARGSIEAWARGFALLSTGQAGRIRVAALLAWQRC